MSPKAGDRVGPYEILHQIGEGGMGVVFLAHDPRLNRQVAIKFLAAGMARDQRALERLRREARAAAALDHPFICKVFEIGEEITEEGGTLYLVMEYIAGETLRHHMDVGRMPAAEVIRMAAECAEALEQAHGAQLLHRDLKPSNIMVTAHGHVKIMDFGLSKRLAEPPGEDTVTLEAQLTVAGTVVGTPDYMSPEQAKGQELDVRSDLFSFGVILAEMLTARHPFRRATRAETLSAVLRDAPNFGNEIPPGPAARRLVTMIRRMLAKNLADRYASIRDVRADLTALAAPADSVADGVSVEVHPPQQICPIGREAEFTHLMHHLEEALAGRGSVVMIGGEPGIGKTYLISALREAARSRGALALRGHCYEMEGSPAYVPFIEHLEDAARNASRETFRFALGEDAPEVARLMPELRKMFPDIPAALELPPEQQRRFLFNAYRNFADRSARLTPIVGVFEDLHWADEPTLHLLEHLAQTVAGMPMLIVGTYRDVELDDRPALARTLESLLRQKLAVRIPLRQLSVSGVEEMLAALSSQKIPPTLANVIFRGTEGNPFFVEEVFRHLVEERQLFGEDGSFRPGLRVDQLEVPETVRLVLRRRLERLSEEARRTLTTAAVIGRTFPLQLLEELERARPDEALDAVEEAERAHLVEMTGRRQTQYRFVHELVRQTLAETLSLPRRQRLHARVAEALERVYHASIDTHIPALAHHLFHAGTSADQEKTIHFLSEAERRATEAAAHEEALDHLGNMLTLLENESSVRAADIYIRRAAALRSLSRTGEAVEDYERALALLEKLGEHGRFVATCAPLFWMHVWTYNMAKAVEVADSAARHAAGASPAERYAAMAMQAGCQGAMGQVDHSLQILDEMLAVPENELTPEAIAFGADLEMRMRQTAGQHNELLAAAAEKGTRIYERVGDIWSQANIEVGVYNPPLQCGRIAEGEALLSNAIRRAEKIGHSNAKYSALVFTVQAWIARGDLKRAEESAREAVAFGESIQAGLLFLAEIRLAVVLLYGDRLAEAVAILEKCANGPPSFYTGTAEALLARALAVSGRDAEAACNLAMRFLPRPGHSRGLGAWHAIVNLVEAQHLRGRLDEAAHLLGQAETVAAEWDYDDFGYPAGTAAGIAAACAGDWARAEKHHIAAIARMDAIPHRTAQWIARYWYATMFAERGGAGDIDRAKNLFQETIDGSNEIGLALYARLGRQRLAALAAGNTSGNTAGLASSTQTGV